MANVRAAHEEHDVLGDVLRVIADPLEALEREHRVEDRLQQARRSMATVMSWRSAASNSWSISRSSRATSCATLRVAAIQRIDRDPHRLRGELGHVAKRPVHHARRSAGALGGAREREARDLLRLVAGALEVGDGARDGEHRAQVARDRRLPRQQAEALGLDLGLPGVDLLLAPQHQLGRLAVGLEQRPDRGLDLLRHQRSHLVGAPAQARQGAVPGLDGVTLAGLVHVAFLPAQP